MLFMPELLEKGNAPQSAVTINHFFEMSRVPEARSYAPVPQLGTILWKAV
jgi:hypothetical protein